MRVRTAIAVWLALAAAACSRKPSWPPAAAAVHLGEDACGSCRMIISDERFGAQLHQRGGPVVQFDDLGCLLRALPPGGVDPVAIFVRGYPGGAWLRGDRAHVVRAHGFDAPMGSELAAFATREEAAAEAARHPGAVAQPLSDLLERSRR